MLKRKKKQDCKCRSKTFGNPKYGHGICYHSGNVRAAVRLRIDWRKKLATGDLD